MDRPPLILTSSILRGVWTALLAAGVIAFLTRWFLPDPPVLVFIPVWGLAIALGVMETLRYRCRRVRQWRVHRGQICPTCGYDLRASIGRCPECGELIETPFFHLRPPV